MRKPGVVQQPPEQTPSAPGATYKPTTQRRHAFGDHQPPTGKHAAGRERSPVWHGTSRIVDRPARQRSNRRSWAAAQRRSRTEATS